ncbi:hypothetical protein PLEOSDRAFT_1036364 [Pleurotus ostreatus PC15]|uniref:Uncharacterized protein n=1 Tax=Pleurotus ostreatus (strain PC15) TaxID=1137138 RepID=A0A067NQ91_PLEO1|nr:hypothetical protein PLEOSDRAFT_1036364 [Pleurotus ostreatus PC15]
MTSVTTSLSDSLTSVPKLLSSGKNFTMFSERFKIGVDAKGFWGHFDGTSPCPPATVPTAGGDEADTTEVSPNLVYAQWKKDEAAARALLTQKLPDTALVLVLGLANVKLCWDAIVKEYSKKGMYAMAGMRRKGRCLRVS